MKPFARTAMVLALAGAVTAGAAGSASARSWKPWAAAGAGFAAGAIVGSALTAPRYYGPGYSAYAYGPGYAYAPAYDAYAYEPAVTYEPIVVAPTYYYGGYYGPNRGCAVRGNYGGKVDYGAC
jgi:hypothetical protein